MMIIDYKP